MEFLQFASENWQFGVALVLLGGVLQNLRQLTKIQENQGEILESLRETVAEQRGACKARHGE